MTDVSAQPLVPPEAKAMIGKRLDRRSGVVYQKEAQRFAAASGDMNPIYFDEAFARAHGYRTTPAPPLFLTQVLQGVTDLERLSVDGVPAGGDSIPLNVQRKMAGGEEYEFLAPFYPGDTLTAETVIKDIEEKDGRSGAFALVTRETTYTNQHGEVVARARMSMIAR